MASRPDELAGLLARLPPSWRRELAGHDIVRVHSGMSGASVLRIGPPESAGAYLKIAHGRAVADLRDEIARTRWLAQKGIRVPDISRVFESDEISAVLTGAVSGAPAFQHGWQLARDIEAVARGLRQLHSLSVEDCPFDETIRVRLARANQEIDRGAVDPSHFDPRNAGIAPRTLWERLTAEIPEENLVVVHGDATPANILIDSEGQVGFIDCGRAGRSDRYTDLALLVEELRNEFGPEAAESFLRAYGDAGWNERKALYFLDLYELF
jgi:aminoglycoside phosphotransferase